MSVTLPTVSLASVSVGQNGTVSLKNVGPDANPSYTQKPPHLALFNESGVGLLINFQQGGDSFFLPAGGWIIASIVPGENQLNWQVQYILNVVGGAPVSQLLITYYGPNEQVPNMPQLGNSPIGGAVSTSSIQTLSQEGQPKTLLTIDIGDSALAQLITINNDGTSTWKVDVAGVAHTIFQIASAANFLKIGQAGDTIDFLSTLLMPNNVAIQMKDSGGTVRTILNNNAANNVGLQAAGNNTVSLLDNGGNILAQATGPVATTAFETFGSLKLDGRTTTINGSVSGNAIVYELLTGNVKLTAIVQNGYSNSGTKTVALNFPYTANSFWLTGSIGQAPDGGIQVTELGATQNFNIYTSIGAGGFGNTSQATINQNTLSTQIHAFDTIAFLVTTGAHSSFTFIIGN